MGVHRARGAKRAFAPRLEIGMMKPLFQEKLEVGILIPIDWFDSCNDSFFCRYETLTAQESVSVIVSCSDELAVHTCPLLFLQRRVAKVASGFFYC